MFVCLLPKCGESLVANIPLDVQATIYLHIATKYSCIQISTAISRPAYKVFDCLFHLAILELSAVITIFGN